MLCAVRERWGVANKCICTNFVRPDAAISSRADTCTVDLALRLGSVVHGQSRRQPRRGVAPIDRTSLNTDFGGVEWVVSAYTLTFAALVLPSGALADRFGRKPVLIVGLALFAGASYLCGSASSIVALTTARVLQGVGAAFQLSAALALLSHEFQGQQRTRAFAAWGSVVGAAVMIGPVVGGAITQALGWEWGLLRERADRSCRDRFDMVRGGGFARS